MYILKGKGSCEDSRGNAFQIEPGCLYQRFPGVEHGNMFWTDEEFAECYLVFPSQVADLLLATGGISLSEPHYNIGVSETIYARFDQIYQNMSAYPEHRLHELLAEMYALLVSLLAKGEGGDKQNRFVEKACSLLFADWKCQYSLEDMAVEMGMSYSQFRQQFRDNMKMSPGVYRQTKRMEMAQQMLVGGTAIKSVAEQLGYSDVYAFSKQFKHHTGMAPKQFVRCMNLE